MGARSGLADEFTDIFIVNLRGDANKAGREFQKEGEKIFGAGSRSGVQITFLVRNPSKDNSMPARIHYMAVPEYSTLKKKFQWLEDIQNVYWEEAEITPKETLPEWKHIPDMGYSEMMPVCAMKKQKQQAYPPVTAFSETALGVTTACDNWAYAWDKNTLAAKIEELLYRYSAALADVIAVCDHGEKPSDELLGELMEKHEISDVEKLKQSLRRKDDIVFDPSLIREVLYRPFTKQYLYADPKILSSVNTIAAMFPKDETSEALGLTTGSNRGMTDSLVATGSLPDINNLRGGVSASFLDGYSDHSEEHAVSSFRSGTPAGSGVRERQPADQGDPANSELDGGGRREHFAISCPSNTTIFTVLAVSVPPDLKGAGTSQACRVVQRYC